MINLPENNQKFYRKHQRRFIHHPKAITNSCCFFHYFSHLKYDRSILMAVSLVYTVLARQISISSGDHRVPMWEDIYWIHVQSQIEYHEIFFSFYPCWIFTKNVHIFQNVPDIDPLPAPEYDSVSPPDPCYTNEGENLLV